MKKSLILLLATGFLNCGGEKMAVNPLFEPQIVSYPISEGKILAFESSFIFFWPEDLTADKAEVVFRLFSKIRILKKEIQGAYQDLQTLEPDQGGERERLLQFIQEKEIEFADQMTLMQEKVTIIDLHDSQNSYISVKEGKLTLKLYGFNNQNINYTVPEDFSLIDYDPVGGHLKFIVLEKDELGQPTGGGYSFDLNRYDEDAYFYFSGSVGYAKGEMRRTGQCQLSGPLQ